MSAGQDAVARLVRGSQLIQSDELPGIYKGIVEDVEDPFGLGRLRVRIYCLHGSKLVTPTKKIGWAEAVAPLEGSFNPPEVNDRVWVIFENGHRFHPVWIGHWFAIPTGLGEEPFSKRQGSEVPREVWLNHARHPQARSIARSAEGNQLWFEDQTVGNDFLASVNLQDVGGKFLRISSFLTGKGQYDPEHPEDTRHRKKDLANTTKGKGIPGLIQLDVKGYALSARTMESGSCFQSDAQQAEDSSAVTQRLNGVLLQNSVAVGSRRAKTVLTGKQATIKANTISLMGKTLILPRSW